MRPAFAVAMAIALAATACGSGASDECVRQTRISGGLKYRDLTCGTGDDAFSGATVLVHYEGTLEDGTTFESTRTRGDPLRFVVGSGEVIEGFDSAVAGMAEGGMRRVEVAPELAYGEAGLPPTIPPNATLVFEIELLEVEEE